jgi:hypothetical protein
MEAWWNDPQKGPSGVTKVTDEERITRLTRLAFSWKALQRTG